MKPLVERLRYVLSWIKDESMCRLMSSIFVMVRAGHSASWGGVQCWSPVDCSCASHGKCHSGPEMINVAHTWLVFDIYAYFVYSMLLVNKHVE